MTREALVRWIQTGRPGRHRRAYLDGIKDPRRGWLSSVPAVLRFLAEVRIDEAMPEKVS